MRTGIQGDTHDFVSVSSRSENIYGMPAEYLNNKKNDSGVEIMLGENLYFYRRKRGLSRRALSELSGGIHPATIAAIENNRSISPRGDKIGKLAKALGLTVKMLTDPRRPELRTEEEDFVLRVAKPEGTEFTDRDLHLIHNILKSVITEVANSKRKLREAPAPKVPKKRVKKIKK